MRERLFRRESLSGVLFDQLVEQVHRLLGDEPEVFREIFEHARGVVFEHRLEIDSLEQIFAGEQRVQD